MKDGQLQELTALTNQTEEERVRLVTELAACSRKVEAMAIVVQNTVDKVSNLYYASCQAWCESEFENNVQNGSTLFFLRLPLQ